MSLTEHIADGETGYDRVLRFSIPGRNARGRMVRLGPVLDTILTAHDYPPPIRGLLAEALVLTALLGTLLKDEGSQLTMQAQTEDGVVDLLVCDYRNGELRGYVRHDPERLAQLGRNPRSPPCSARVIWRSLLTLPPPGSAIRGLSRLRAPAWPKPVKATLPRASRCPP